MSDFVTAIDLTAVAVFAISGALAAASQKLDILGFILFGTITQGIALPVAIGLAFLLRGAAISFELRLPKFGR